MWFIYYCLHRELSRLFTAMARITEGNIATGTWARPATPQMEKVGNEWVSKGWNDLEHKDWVFKVHYSSNSENKPQMCPRISKT
jgi:hypothetical protein